MHESFANAAALGLQPSDPGGQGSLTGGALTAASHVMLLSQEHHDLAHAVQLDGRADRSISRQGLGFGVAAGCRVSLRTRCLVAWGGRRPCKLRGATILCPHVYTRHHVS